MGRVDYIFCFISEDEEGNEGICCYPEPRTGLIMPLVCADPARAVSMRPIAELIKTDTGMKKIKFLRFSRRSLIEEI